MKIDRLTEQEVAYLASGILTEEEGYYLLSLEVLGTCHHISEDFQYGAVLCSLLEWNEQEEEEGEEPSKADVTTMIVFVNEVGELESDITLVEVDDALRRNLSTRNLDEEYILKRIDKYEIRRLFQYDGGELANLPTHLLTLLMKQEARVPKLLDEFKMKSKIAKRFPAHLADL